MDGISASIKKLVSMRAGPSLVTLFVSTAVIFIFLFQAGGDPLVFARIGTRFSEGDLQGSEGYDGQFVYYIASDPNTARVAPFLDVPAYRYQRILLPLLARALALGQANVIPWMIIIIGIFSLSIGTWAVSELLRHWEMNPWYALIYGLWSGFLLALITDLPEPLAYALAALGLLALEQSRKVTGWLLLGISIFAKEVTIMFIVSLAVIYIAKRLWKDFFCLGLIALLPYLLFQIFLWQWFGEFGIGSGGFMATSFEWIPFMGLFRIGGESWLYLLAMALVFGPALVFPAVWGMWVSMRSWLSGERNLYGVALTTHSLMIAAAPYSTFRETGGILRYMSGLVLAALLFSGRNHLRKSLNYQSLWMVLNVFLLK